jgi:hypothetical protein
MRSLAGGIVTVAVALVVVATPADADAFSRCGGLRATTKGTPGPDVIQGTKGLDVVSAGAGDDRVEGLEGGDFLCGGPGDDVLDAGVGNDKVRGGAGDDTLIGGDGYDYVYGQSGDDRAIGDEGLDACFTEDSASCEADLSVVINSPRSFVAGDQQLYNMTLDVRADTYVGGGAANGAYVEVTLPRAAEFSRDDPDPRCTESTPDRVMCGLGYVEPRAYLEPYTVSLAMRFPDCPGPDPPASIAARVADTYTSDPFPRNNEVAQEIYLNGASSCP